MNIYGDRNLLFAHFLEVITKSVLEAFLKIYGDRALAAALTMPEFQAAALELQK